MSFIIFRICLWGFACYVGHSWVKWARSEVKLVPPRWRSGIAVFGFAAATISLLLMLVLGVHAMVTGGFPYYHPTLMLAMAIGLLTAIFGVLAAIAGKGPLEIPTIICSTLCLLIWFGSAIAQ